MAFPIEEMVLPLHTGYFLGKYGEKYEGGIVFVRFFDILEFTMPPLMYARNYAYNVVFRRYGVWRNTRVEFHSIF